MRTNTRFAESGLLGGHASGVGLLGLASRPRRKHRGGRPGDDDIADGPLRFVVDLLLHPEKVWRKVADFVDGLIDAAVVPVALAVASAVLAALIAFRVLAALRDRRLSRTGHLLRIQPPPEIDERGAEVLWTGLHGLIRPRLKRAFLGQPTFTWEVRAREDDVEVLLWVPDTIPLSFVERALMSAWPGASIIEVEAAPWEPKKGSIAAAAELRLARPQWFPLGEGPDSSPLRLALAALSTVSGSESAVVQVVAMPMAANRGRRLIRGFDKARRRAAGQAPKTMGSEGPSPPTGTRNPTADVELRAVHTKAASPLWACTLRLAVAAGGRGTAKARIHSIASAFAMFEGTNGLRRRRVLRGVAAIGARRMRRPIPL